MTISKFEFIETIVSRHEYYDLIDSYPEPSKREDLIEGLYKDFSQRSQDSKAHLVSFINEFYDSLEAKPQSSLTDDERSNIEEVFYEIVCKAVDEGNTTFKPTSEQLESFFEKFMKNFDNTKDVIDQVYNFFNTSSMAKI